MNKFHDIFLELEQQIVQGDYQPGDLLPSENQLVETYNVSRETIRKALNLLINAGYIQKKQGKGSIVLNFKKFNFPISGVTSYKELQQTQHIESHTHVVSLEEIPVERNLAQLTGWTEGAPVWRLVRQREIEGEVDILDIDYLIKEIVQNCRSTVPKIRFSIIWKTTLAWRLVMPRKKLPWNRSQRWTSS